MKTLNLALLCLALAGTADAAPSNVLFLVADDLNCALGADEMRPYVAELSRVADTFVSCYPNAGLPNAFGEYDESPETMSGVVGEIASSGLINIIGGC